MKQARRSPDVIRYACPSQMNLSQGNMTLATAVALGSLDSIVINVVVNAQAIDIMYSLYLCFKLIIVIVMFKCCCQNQ